MAGEGQVRAVMLVRQITVAPAPDADEASSEEQPARVMQQLSVLVLSQEDQEEQARAVQSRSIPIIDQRPPVVDDDCDCDSDCQSLCLCLLKWTLILLLFILLLPFLPLICVCACCYKCCCDD